MARGVAMQGDPVSEWLPALLIGLTAAALFAGGVAWLVLRLTRGITEAGTAYFAALAQGGGPEAQRWLSDAFLASTPEPALRTWLGAVGLADGGQAAWFNRKRLSGRGVLTGHVQAAGGRVVVVRLVLVKQHGAWRIQTMSCPKGLFATYVDRSGREPPGIVR